MGLDPGVAKNRLFQERYAPLTWGIGLVKLPWRRVLAPDLTPNAGVGFADQRLEAATTNLLSFLYLLT